MEDLDDLDQRLVAALRADGRAAVSKLAIDLRVSRATVENRMKRLIDQGILLGFTIRLPEANQASLIRAIMSIEVVGKSTTAIIKNLHGLPEVTALHTTNGAWDLIAEIRTINLQEFDRVLRVIRGIDGVLNSETSLLLSSV
jgi:DNA-binding Lrp family transcriptional regulator